MNLVNKRAKRNNICRMERWRGVMAHPVGI